jgi:hypothetical protein
MRNIKIPVLVALLVVMSVAFIAHSDEAVNRNAQSNPRTEASIPRTDVQIQAQAGLGEQETPRLDAGIESIESQYRARAQALKAELAVATSSQAQEDIMQAMVVLKSEWALAIANRQLELARLNGNTEAEAEILQAISRMPSPPAPVPHAAPQISVPAEADAQGVVR